jgi:hypothetical protein
VHTYELMDDAHPSELAGAASSSRGEKQNVRRVGRASFYKRMNFGGLPRDQTKIENIAKTSKSCVLRREEISKTVIRQHKT